MFKARPGDDSRIKVIKKTHGRFGGTEDEDWWKTILTKLLKSPLVTPGEGGGGGGGRVPPDPMIESILRVSGRNSSMLDLVHLVLHEEERRCCLQPCRSPRTAPNSIREVLRPSGRPRPATPEPRPVIQQESFR